MQCTLVRRQRFWDRWGVFTHKDGWFIVALRHEDETTSGPVRKSAEAVIKHIRQATRRQFSAQEKIRIVLKGLRGEDSIGELCWLKGIASSMY